MLFNSVEFLIFLPLFFILYWSIGKQHLKIQNFLILVGSYIFYGWWDWRFLILIFISTIIDYSCSLAIENSKNKRTANFFLFTSLFVNLGILCFFKYYNFFIDSWINGLKHLGYESGSFWVLNIILPVGISFYTFQTLSYTIDVYQKKISAEKNLVNFAAFVSFFPQLVAGPIERAENLLPQIKHARKFSYGQAVSGLRLILWGFFKKIVIADALAPLVEEIFSNYQHLNGGILLLGLVYFGVQIYCDFSGYTDIARGSAKLLGFEIMVNFRFPYFSKTITEFWRRWHISLSTWFRDYIYIPLGGSRVSKYRIIRNIFAVFLISGLWHGANWTFLAWGFAHALFFIPVFFKSKSAKNLTPKKSFIRDGLGIAFTFTIVTLAWVFFRSPSIQEAFVYLGRCFSELQIPGSHRSGMEQVLIIFVCDFFLRKDQGNLDVLNSLGRAGRWMLYLVFGLWVMSAFNTYQSPFIYFQF